MLIQRFHAGSRSYTTSTGSVIRFGKFSRAGSRYEGQRDHPSGIYGCSKRRPVRQLRPTETFVCWALERFLFPDVIRSDQTRKGWSRHLGWGCGILSVAGYHQLQNDPGGILGTVMFTIDHNRYRGDVRNGLTCVLGCGRLAGDIGTRGATRSVPDAAREG